jgi:Reversibly glycosylated polypeptide
VPLKAAIVLTTIGDLALLEGYYPNLLAHGHLERARVIVIPDRKTPVAAFDRCAALGKKGLSIVCPSLEEQECFLRKAGFASELIPYDSDNRRNVGYLMALREPSDFLMSIDDDNFAPAEEDFFAQHSVVCGDARAGTTLDASEGWFNICTQLNLEPDSVTYPRGFPYFARHRKQTTRQQACVATIRINAGLWLQEPDLDAMTWLSAPVRATSFRGESVVLGPQTWSPVNTQNTALHRTAIPSYYFVRMGLPLSGMRIDRYGDIFSGYFSQACARSLGHAVRVGTPIATHTRNSHNYLRGATQELACICVLEDLLPWLQEARLEGGDYLEAHVSLSHQMEDAAERFQGFIWTAETRSFFHFTAHHMREWVKACRCIGV